MRFSLSDAFGFTLGFIIIMGILSLPVLLIHEAYSRATDVSTRFWYPIAEYSFSCNDYKAELYLMDHTHMWSSVSYAYDPEIRKRVWLSKSCVYHKIRDIGSSVLKSIDQLNDEQKEHVVYTQIDGKEV